MVPIRGPGGGGDGGAGTCVSVLLETEPRRVVVVGVAIASRIVGASACCEASEDDALAALASREEMAPCSCRCKRVD
jgi:hypothetical protein